VTHLDFWELSFAGSPLHFTKHCVRRPSDVVGILVLGRPSSRQARLPNLVRRQHQWHSRFRFRNKGKAINKSLFYGVPFLSFLFFSSLPFPFCFCIFRCPLPRSAPAANEGSGGAIRQPNLGAAKCIFGVFRAQMSTSGSCKRRSSSVKTKCEN